MSSEYQQSGSIKRRLASGDVLLGPTVNVADPMIIEAICAAGADFVFLDLEHGLKDFSAMAHSIMAAELWGVPVLVRIGERSANLVARMLDVGAAGVIFPHVSTAMEAAEFVSWCRYKPRGQRGSGMTRASIRHSGNEYTRRQQASDDVVCLMVVEDRVGAENLDAILAVDGVTGVAIGPGDLSMDLGVDSWDHPAVLELLETMAATVRRRTGCALLRLGRTADEVARFAATGVNMVLINHDIHLIKAMYVKLFSEFRQSIADAG